VDRASIERAFDRSEALRQEKNAKSSPQVNGVGERGMEGTRHQAPPSLTPQFERAHNNEKTPEQPQKTQGQGSQQVALKAPGMNGPTPPANVRTEAAREPHQNQMSADDKRTEAKHAELKARQDKEKDEKMKNERERD
jgi:hypothetical protein